MTSDLIWKAINARRPEATRCPQCGMNEPTIVCSICGRDKLIGDYPYGKPK